MTINSRPLDWKNYDTRAQAIERRLEALLSTPTYSSDDRRLARVYLGFARLIEDRLDPGLRGYLALAEQYAATGDFPEELAGVSHKLGSISQQLASQEAKRGMQTDQPFIHQLLESSTRKKFAIHPATDVEPIAWMAAIGASVDDIARVVHSIYPELTNLQDVPRKDLWVHWIFVGGSLDVSRQTPTKFSATKRSSSQRESVAADAQIFRFKYSNSGQLLRRFSHGAGVDEPIVWYEGFGMGTKYWLLGDERASIVKYTNSSWAGRLISADRTVSSELGGARFRYTVQMMLPEAQLYHYKARVYDPKLGRFLQTDPIGYEDDVNLYAYVKNDPPNATDPTGMGAGDDFKWSFTAGAGSTFLVMRH